MYRQLDLPSDVTMDAVVDRLARTAWGCLNAGPGSQSLYSGYFVTVYDTIHDYLDRSMFTEERRGGARSLVFSTDSGGTEGLEAALAREIVIRLGHLFAKSQAGQLQEEVLPPALHVALSTWLVPEASGAMARSFGSSRQADAHAGAA